MNMQTKELDIEDLAAFVTLQDGTYQCRSLVTGDVMKFSKGVRTPIAFYDDAIELMQQVKGSSPLFKVELMGKGVDKEKALKELQERKNQIDPSKKKPTRPEDLSSVLMVRHGGMGDLMFILPVAAEFKRRNPSCKIFVQVTDQYAPLLKNQKEIDQVIPEHEPIKQDKFDKVIEFDGSIVQNEKARHLHAVDVMFAVAGLDYENIPKQFKRVDLVLDDGQKEFADAFLNKHDLRSYKSIIGMQLHSTSMIRNWPLPFYKRLAEFFGERGSVVLLFDRKGTQDFEGRGIISLSGQFKISQTVAILSKCDLLIGPDSGLSHVAGYLNTPFLGLFGPFPGALRLKYYPVAHCIQANIDCGPCFLHNSAECPKDKPMESGLCMNLIKPRQVAETAASIVRSLRGVNILEKIA